MFKMEIIIDKDILEKDGYNFQYTLDLLEDNFKRAGFEREFLEGGHMIFTGTNSPKDFSYMGIMYSRLVNQKWFKNCVTYWHLIKDNKDAGDYIEGAKEIGAWYRDGYGR